MEPQAYYQPAPNQISNSQTDKTKKLIFIILILFVLGLFFFIGSLFLNRDESEIMFQRTIVYHQEELRINDLANRYNIENLAFDQFQANLTALVTSDLSSTQAIYPNEIDRRLTESLMDVEAAERFDSANSTNTLIREYQATMGNLIRANIAQMNGLIPYLDEDSAQIINTSIENHQALLGQLDNISS